MIAGILLAAGSSLRFGAPKLLTPLPDGTPIGLAAIKHLQDATEQVFVVIRPTDYALARLFNIPGVTIVTCHQADSGMGHSLAYGVAAANSAQGWIIALADMPHIQSSTTLSIRTLLKSGAPIVTPFFNTRRGHPIGFSATYKDHLLRLTGDQGARSLLQQYRHDVHRLECHDPGILIDIDTPEDLMNSNAILQKG